MSFKPDDIDHELTIEQLLQLILAELKLLNMRYEEACNTGLKEDDV